MNNLQPSKKSFGYYVSIGYKFAAKKTPTFLEKNLFKKISAIDDSILIIDDILDKSKFRNGKPCLYLQIGEEKSIIKSKLLEIEARQNLLNLALRLKTKEEFKVKIIEKFDYFLRDIYLGEQVGQFLVQQEKYSNILIKNYFKMISLFTGGHVRYSIEIGQLLANKEPNSQVSDIAIASGIIRQIVDDFNDYFKKHHEPFGDFLLGSNRLPEILFKKFGGNKKRAIKLLKKGEIDAFLDMVLNKRVREEIIYYCEKESKIINNSKHRNIIPIPDYKFIFRRI